MATSTGKLIKYCTSNKFDFVLSKFPQALSFAFAYGSGVFTQAGQHDTKQNMIDFIFAVDDPVSWHKENLTYNKSHYSLLKYGGPYLVNKIQQEIGAGVYFNTFIPVEDRLIKYGVVSTSRLISDLLDWDSLYISGRLQKPVNVLKMIPSEDLSRSLTINLQSALRAVILSLPESFSEEELYLKIAGLSYTGDFRMMIGEDQNKVSNIVKPHLDKFRMLYEAILKSMPLLHWNHTEGVFEQDCSAKTRLHHLNLLPRTVQCHLLLTWNKDGYHRDLEEVLQAVAHDNDCGELVSEAISSIVWKSSWSQSSKGILTAGVLKSVKYGSKKLRKMVHSVTNKNSKK